MYKYTKLIKSTTNKINKDMDFDFLPSGSKTFDFLASGEDFKFYRLPFWIIIFLALYDDNNYEFNIIQSSNTSLLLNMQSKKDRPSRLNAQKAIGFDFPKTEYVLDERDAIIYALSLGFNQDPLREDQLKYTYQDHPEFTIFPTFCSMVTRAISIGVVFSCPEMPIPPNPLSLLAEQRVEFYTQKLTQGTAYQTTNKICDIIDKGKFVLMGYKLKTYQKDTGNLAFVTYSRTALPGVKGDGFKGNGSIPSLPKKPKYPSTHLLAISIAPNQPLLYRLNGYKNGIHADPKIAKKNKFDRPIMHGIGTLQFCVRAVVQQLWGGDESLLKAYHGRFLNAVYPGQTLVLKVWREQNMQIFEANIKERDLTAVFGMVQRRQFEKL